MDIFEFELVLYRLYFPFEIPAFRASMFNSSSNFIIAGGTFIVVNGNMDRASLEAMGVNISQNPGVESNSGTLDPNFGAPHGQGPITDQFPQRNSCQEADAQASCETQVDPASGSHSAENFGISVHASGRVPEYGPCLPPTPSITSEAQSWGTSQNPRFDSNRKRGNSNPNFCAPHGQGPITDQFAQRNRSQQANAQEFCKPQADSASGSHSAENFGTSVHASGWVPEHGSYPMPTPMPSITPEAGSWDRIRSTSTPVKSVGAPRGNANPNGAPRGNANPNGAPPPPFPMPKPQYASHAVLNKFRKRHLTFSQPEHFQFGAGRQSSCRPRSSTSPFPTPTPPFPIPQLVSGAH